MTQPPVWLLDIDGVLNAAVNFPDHKVWPAQAWRRHKVTAQGHTWPILIADPVVEFIRTVHDAGAAEIRWHTTWQQWALHFADVVGLPEFAVQDCPEYADHGSERWFKLPAAERVLMHECRELLWTDDELRWEPARRMRAVHLMSTVTRVELIGPTVTVGLTPKHLRQIGEFLGLPYGATLSGDTDSGSGS